MQDINRKELLTRISEVQFATIELNMYLDNHPENEAALYDYNKFALEFQNLKSAYEMHYGPLTSFGFGVSELPWQWTEEPWPWELGE